VTAPGAVPPGRILRFGCGCLLVKPDTLFLCPRHQAGDPRRAVRL